MSSSEFREGVGMTKLSSAACFSIEGGDEDCRPGDSRGPGSKRGRWRSWRITWITNKEDAMTFEDDWLRSGDLAYYEEMGNIFLEDRLKELIKYKAIHASVWSPSELDKRISLGSIQINTKAKLTESIHHYLQDQISHHTRSELVLCSSIQNKLNSKIQVRGDPRKLHAIGYLVSEWAFTAKVLFIGPQIGLDFRWLLTCAGIWNSTLGLPIIYQNPTNECYLMLRMISGRCIRVCSTNFGYF